jgi:acyl-coenzyme A thioesterase PaaI-like protein
MNLLEERGTANGLEQLRSWIASGRQPGIGETLKFSLVEVSEGRAVFSATPGAHAYNPIGSVHGGYAATLLDSACGCAVHDWLSETPLACSGSREPSLYSNMVAVQGRETSTLLAQPIGKPRATGESHQLPRFTVEGSEWITRCRTRSLGHRLPVHRMF